MKRTLLVLAIHVLTLLTLHGQPYIKGPLTTNSPAIKTAATGGLIDCITNNFFRVPVEVNTNLVITNLALGQVIRIEVWPTNGFTVTFAQQTASNTVQGWVRPLTSNQWNTVYVSRPDSTTTNFDIRAADYITVAGSGVFFATNFAARTVTVTATNVNGEVSVTNATRIGLVTDRAGITNQLRSLQGGDLVTLTNQGTNVMIAAAAAYTIVLGSAGGHNLADSTTYYVGGDLNANLNTTYLLTSVEVPKAGTLKRVFIKVRCPSTLASGEAVSHYIRINDTTDVTVNTTATYDTTSTNIAAAVSQAVVAGDFVNLKVATPAWVTNPASVRYYAILYIE